MFLSSLTTGKSISFSKISFHAESMEEYSEEDEAMEEEVNEDLYVVLWNGCEANQMVLELEQLLKHNNLKTWSWVSEPNQALNPWLEAVEMKLKLKGTKVLFLVTYEGVVKKNWPILQELQMCKNNQIPIHVVIAEGNSRDDISKGVG